MIKPLQALLSRATKRSADAELEREEKLREKEAEEKANRDAAKERAATLSAKAGQRREAGDRTSAAIYYAEAITLLRDADAAEELAHVLSHAADVRSEMREYGVAGTMIEESMRLYGAFDPPDALHYAFACRIAALNSERRARSAWKQALDLYISAGVSESVTEAEEHLGNLERYQGGKAAGRD